jgi:hypothetical protein
MAFNAAPRRDRTTGATSPVPEKSYDCSRRLELDLPGKLQDALCVSESQRVDLTEG